MIRFSGPTIYAHRGASAYAPENTMAAFQLAVQHQADAIELDVKLSADHQLVVFHDASLKRTTGAEGKVSEKTLAELKTLDAGSWFSGEYAGEAIPTLDEVFESLGRHLFINIELTNYFTPADSLVEKVVERVRKHKLEDFVLFSSFLPTNVHKARRLLPEVPAALIALPGFPGLVSRSRIGRWFSPHYINPHYTDVDQEWIGRQHRYGRRVLVWTVNEPDAMRRLFKWGVDGIITDDPRLARQVLEESNDT
jgi:glycerophosphoryl diester phosphodiesterase